VTSKLFPFPLAPATDAVAERLEKGLLRCLVDSPGFVTRAAAAEGAAFTVLPPSGGNGAAQAPGRDGATAGRRSGIATLGSTPQGRGATESGPGAGDGGGKAAKAAKFSGSARTLGSKAATTVSAPAASAPPAGTSAREQARQARLAVLAAAEDRPEDADPMLAELGLLESMGFGTERAREALRACGGDVRRAGDLLASESV